VFKFHLLSAVGGPVASDTYKTDGGSLADSRAEIYLRPTTDALGARYELREATTAPKGGGRSG